MIPAPMDLDALRLALLAVLAAERAELHRVHGELEHWLNRPLATDDIEAALAELETRGLVDADRAASAATVAYFTTDAGRAIVAERWEEFFPE
jgi:DNA-binding PadR family transcriptional regulator